MTFPLPCSSFEELMIAKDSLAYPCDIWVRMRFAGEFDQTIFRDCWREIIRMHPLFSCRTERGLSGHRWVKKEPVPEMEWIFWSASETDNATNEHKWPEPKRFSLENGQLMFPSIVDYQNGTYELVIQLHHVLCDGLGILDALEDLWTLYDRVVSGASHKRLDRFSGVSCEKRLVSRNRFGLNWKKLLNLFPLQLVGLAGVRQFLMRSPVPLLPHNPPQSFPVKVSSIETAIDAPLFRSIRAYAQKHTVTVNECLAAAIFDAVAEFRKDQKGTNAADWIRMMIPMDMRTSEDKKNLTACNVVGSVFLDRQPAQISDFDRLLLSINREMTLIKENKLAFMFLLSIWLRRYIRFGRHGSTVVKRCETTVVFTNLGRAFPRSKLSKLSAGLQCGKVVLQDFSALAPLNPFTVLAISFCEFASVPRLQLRYCDRVVTTEEANSIMIRILGRLQKFTT
ncbi:MAG: condensation domain-containing protein [Pirellula sp.]|jgi:NRPS condensation-like uncharacterized protein